MIRAVYFDIDNTIINYDEAHFEAMAAIFRFGEDEFAIGPTEMSLRLKEAHQAVIKRVGPDHAAIHNRLIRFQCFLEQMNYTDLSAALKMNEIYWDVFLQTIAVEPGLAEFLQALREAGILLGIGSDQNASIQYQKLDRLGILPWFSRIVTSEEAGVEKPGAAFFRLCVEKAGCRAEECAFIGDNIKKDVEGANHNGLQGVWYHPGHQADEEYGFPVIRSYRDCLKEIVHR